MSDLRSNRRCGVTADSVPTPRPSDADLDAIEANYCADTAVHHRLRSLVASLRLERASSQQLRDALTGMVIAAEAAEWDTFSPELNYARNVILVRGRSEQGPETKT